MSISRQPAAKRDSRANQKERTRSALVDAAMRLSRQGGLPSVAEAAEAAKVSRATAYRYFPTEEALRIEVAKINPATEPIETLLGHLPTEAVEERLILVLDRFTEILLAEEPHMRTALRIQLDTWLDSHRSGVTAPLVREGRRMRWLEQILGPVRNDLSAEQWTRLRAALALTLGIDAIIVMKDVCRISDEAEIRGVLRWAALTLLRAGLEEA